MGLETTLTVNLAIKIELKTLYLLVLCISKELVTVEGVLLLSFIFHCENLWRVTVKKDGVEEPKAHN